MYMGMSKCRNSSGHGDTDSEGRSPEREKVRQHIDGISALCIKAPNDEDEDYAKFYNYGEGRY